MSTISHRSYESVGNVDVAIIGGGPAGAAAARVLAERGHRVSLFTRDPDPVRAFTESLPPSASQLLTTIGIRDAMDDGRFVRSYGNTVWWAERDGEDQRFGAEAHGFQVFRPRFDAMLLDHAAAAGADIRRGAAIGSVGRASDHDGLRLRVLERQREAYDLQARLVIDCSGRAGVLARQHRVYQPALRGQALIGVWRSAAWPIADPGHTLVESWEDGWGWSVPGGAEASSCVRHIGMLVDGERSGLQRGAGFAATYLATLARMRHLQSLVADAVLERAWACDASVYSSRQYGGDGYLVAGDAASFIEPLSSFGVKKALASGWMAAVAAHTCLLHRDRRGLALEFFSDWERRVYATSVERSRRYAGEALARYDRPFWQARAAVSPPPAAVGVDDLLAATGVQRTFERIRSTPACLRVSPAVTVVPHPVIRDGIIVPEDAILLPEDTLAIRFVRGVDVLAVIDLARVGLDAGTLIARYVERFGSHTLPDLLTAIALLIDRSVLIADPIATSTKT
jgi:flavin-dependent dehydrogenase